jgi:anti-sigma B factor antagonist
VADLDVRAERQDGRCVLTVSGELDLSTVAQLEGAYRQLVTAGPIAELVLDLAGVSFVDSSGLGALLRLRAEQMSAGGSLTISAVAAGPARVIDIAGLSETFGLPGRSG